MYLSRNIFFFLSIFFLVSKIDAFQVEKLFLFHFACNSKNKEKREKNFRVINNKRMRDENRSKAAFLSLFFLCMPTRGSFSMIFLSSFDNFVTGSLFIYFKEDH